MEQDRTTKRIDKQGPGLRAASLVLENINFVSGTVNPAAVDEAVRDQIIPATAGLPGLLRVARTELAHATLDADNPAA